ncbi:MAG: acyl-CoA carboxylase subunit beta [Mycobacteriaceae bacterium]
MAAVQEKSAAPARADTTAAKLAGLRAMQDAKAAQGSPRAIASRAEAGLLNARQRIDLLFDPGSFVETGELARKAGAGNPLGDGVVTGYGTVDGRPVCVFSHDATIFGGSLGEVFGRKVTDIYDLALRVGCPVVGINDGGGARVQEGVAALAFFADIGQVIVRASGAIPQISMVMGACAGGAVYGPAMTDFVVAVQDTSYMFVTGPDVLRSVTGEDVTLEELGGAHAQGVGGNVHHIATDDTDAIDWVRELLGVLPSNFKDLAPVIPTDLDLAAELTERDRELDELMPDADNTGYDMQEVIARIVDDGDLLEIAPLFAGNLITGFGRVEGRTVGVVANQPLNLTGALDIDASEKGARFVRFCDAFGIPVLTVVDVPGYMPGVAQERGGIIRRGAKLIFAYSEASVPKVTVVVRKAYGGGYAVMGSKHFGADVNLAWPTARIAVMGAEGAVTLLRRRELAAAGDGAAALRMKYIDDYNEHVATPYSAAERGYVDAVIAPSSTRRQVAAALRALRSKEEDLPPRKHNTMPL